MKIKTGYSKNILVHGKCKVVPTKGKYWVQIMTPMVRPDGTIYYLYDAVKLVNKDEVSDIKEEEI